MVAAGAATHAPDSSQARGANSEEQLVNKWVFSALHDGQRQHTPRTPVERSEK